MSTEGPLYKGKNNVFITQSLFWDMWVECHPNGRSCNPVFTFSSDREFEGPDGKYPLINFKKTFVELGEPTGYDWAMQYLESYDHWLYLMKRKWFVAAYEKALTELETKQRAAALKRIAEISKSPNEAQAFAASRYLAEKGWEKNRRGRPTKKEDSVKNETDEDMIRLGLTVIPGGKS